MLQVYLLSLFAQVEASRDAWRVEFLLIGFRLSFRLAYPTRQFRFLLVLFRKPNFFHLITDVLKTLLFKLAHETPLRGYLLKEEFFLYAVKLSRHACADERCYMDTTLSAKNILTPNNATIPKEGDLVHFVLLACGLRAHVLTHRD